MVKLRVLTHSGSEDIVEVENYNAAEMAELINGNDKHVIAIGDIVYSRIDIKGTRPIKEDETELPNNTPVIEESESE